MREQRSVMGQLYSYTGQLYLRLLEQVRAELSRFNRPSSSRIQGLKKAEETSVGASVAHEHKRHIRTTRLLPTTSTL